MWPEKSFPLQGERKNKPGGRKNRLKKSFPLQGGRIFWPGERKNKPGNWFFWPIFSSARLQIAAWLGLADGFSPY